VSGLDDDTVNLLPSTSRHALPCITLLSHNLPCSSTENSSAIE
jgi:hypothetical protein